MTDTQINNLIYTTTIVREKKTYFFISLALVIILSALNILKIYSGTIKFTNWDIIWFIIPFIMIYKLADKLTYKAVYNVTDKLLIITKSNLFYNKTKTYNISEIEQVEVEDIQIQTFIPYYNKTTYDKAVTFFYGEKQVTIDLTNFKAHELADAITANV
jgi:hypothetical protein